MAIITYRRMFLAAALLAAAACNGGGEGKDADASDQETGDVPPDFLLDLPDVPDGDAAEEPRDAPDADAPEDVEAEEDAPDVPPPPIPIGFWCGPPDAFISPERYAEVLGAGFNFLMPPCEGAPTSERNTLILDAAADAGIRAWIGDGRMPMAVTGIPDATDRLDAIVADYASHPALAGYYITDEPGAAAFAGLAEVVAYLRSIDPSHPAYINLLPNYATSEQLGTPTYREHVQQFLDVVQPEILSYDHYHFLVDGDRPGFFDNLAVVRELALLSDVPFWQIVLLTQHYGYRHLTEPELLWEAMHTLVYGGKGVMFFTYWSVPDAAFQPAVIALDGTRTAYYDQIARVNAAARAIGSRLMEATSTGVFQNGPLAPGGAPRPPGAAVLIPGEAPVTAGIFEAGADTPVLLVNRDYAGAVSFDALLAAGSAPPEKLDEASGLWADAAAVPQPDGTLQVHVDLAPGDGDLFLLHGPLSAGPPGPEVMIGIVRADAGFMHMVDSDHGTATIGPGSWDTCFPGFTLDGHDVQSNGFWLCARDDLLSRTFYVGNVVADEGFYYRVQGGAVERLADASWNTCAEGSLLGTYFESDGFWICML
jgi:hypothetical protein